MNEKHNGLPIFSCLKDESQVKKIITRKVNCLKHGKFDAEFCEYEDGTMFQKTYCPECEKEKLEQEQKKLAKQIQEEKIQHCKSCNIEPEYYDKTLGDYIPKTESQKKALEGAKAAFGGGGDKSHMPTAEIEKSNIENGIGIIIWIFLNL